MKKSPAPPVIAETPDDDLTVTQVAALLRRRYHKARDLMLLGKLGETQYAGHTLTVKRSAVTAFQKAEAQQRAKRS